MVRLRDEIGLLHNEVRLLNPVELFTLRFAYRMDVTSNQLTLEYMAFELDDIADADLVHTAQAFRVDVNVGTSTVLKKAIAL